MHDPKLIEAMARAMEACPPSDNLPPEHPNFKIWGIWENEATAALSALCTLRPDVAAVLRGEAVALPKTPTDAQWDHIAASLDAHPASLLMERQRRWWPDFIAASPYAQETPEDDMTCERCQGNGEIVTDWNRYLHAEPGDKGDEAVADCPDCEQERAQETPDAR